MELNTSSKIYLSRSALKKNHHFIRQIVGPNKIVCSVIKGNAYGHGINIIVPELEVIGIDHFCVFSSTEARQAHAASNKNSTIIIMGDVSNEDLEWVIKNNIECFVFNIHRLSNLIEEAIKQNKKAKIHIELETGMNRTGFNDSRWLHVANEIANNSDHIEFKGICTHFAGAESIANYVRIQEQKSTFEKGIAFFKERALEPELIHAACSAAMISYPETHYDMVRVGIIQYGLWPSKETFIAYLTRSNITEDPLKRVISWKSYIMDIKTVKTGDFIGYGTSFLAESEMKIASVPVGYGYGYSRVLSNSGRVLVNGQRLSVIGLVNMNMLLIDVSYLDVNPGDVVTLIGNDGEMQISISSFSNLSDQLNYELLTRLDKDINRIVIE